MKCKIPEISWHNRDPVLSVDIQTGGHTINKNIYRLASGGTDAHVLIWHMKIINGVRCEEIELDLAADLTRHQRAVNCVKWSPNGELLASGDDESVVFIWKQKLDSESVNIVDNTNEQDKEIWITLKILRGHMEDVYDLSWSPNSMHLVTGSVDNSAIVWDVQKGKSLAILNDHKGFVQGVAWDPKNQYIATLSTDRFLRIFDVQTKKVLQRVSKGCLPVEKSHALHSKRMRFYHDDTLQTFFRRLTFTPDGKLLLTPAGVTDYEGVTKPLHTTYIFTRYNLRQPAIVLPCPDQYTVVISCCPLLYRLRPYNQERNPPVVPLPYRMIFAVASRSSVYFYDTQQKPPFAIISNIHYTRLTDLTWSDDGRIVVVSSTDGFCSLITFEAGELGEVYEDSKIALQAALAPDLSTSVKKPKKSKDNESFNQKLCKSLSEVATENKNEREQEKIVKQTSGSMMVTENEAKKSKNTENYMKEKFPPSSKQINKTEHQVLCSGTLPTKVLSSVDIILDKEILSSDEKFESPEKKCRPAIPITVRRHPRTPSTTTKTTSPDIKNNKEQKATSVQVRKAPCRIETTPSATSFVEEEAAMDAWPVQNVSKADNSNDGQIVAEVNVDKEMQESRKNIEKTPISSIQLNETTTTSERTEDMRLIYEETVEENIELANKAEIPNETKPNTNEQTTIAAAKNDLETVPACAATTEQQQQAVLTPKTPRRVPFRTISTPKSTKKTSD